MTFTIKNRTFEQVDPYQGELLFVTDDKQSLVGVTFDKHNTPCVNYKEGPVYFTGLPTPVETEFIKRIKEYYPNGFEER